MKKTIEGFLEELRKNNLNVPSIVTNENVNSPIYNDLDGLHWTLLEFAVYERNIDVVPILLFLGAQVTIDALNIARAYGINDIFIPLINVYGDIDYLVYLYKDNPIFCEGLLDDGCTLSICEKEKCPRLHEYQLLVLSRVTSSRKALVALIICSKMRNHQGTLVFGSIRDVLFVVAREMWVQKGPGGCGPRSTGWKNPQGE